MPITATTRRRSRSGSPSRCAGLPREIAEELAAAARASEWVASADVAGPGFVNVRVSPAWYAEAVRRAREPGFGGGTAAASLKVNVEYVSANPTGALPVSAGRNAAYGDSLARVFAFAGHEVTREYYFNDSGAQIDRFGLSLRARARGEPVPEDGYQGENLIALAEQTGLPRDASAEAFGRAGVTLMFAAIRATLERFRVHMDVFTNEVDLHRSGGVERALARADAGGHVFEAEGASWLRASEFGDDKDRVLIKADGSPTYFAGDLAYLVDKLERGFDLAIYVLGADHFSATPKAAAPARGHSSSPPPVARSHWVHRSICAKPTRISKWRGDAAMSDELTNGCTVSASPSYPAPPSHDPATALSPSPSPEPARKTPVFPLPTARAPTCESPRPAADSATRLPPAAPLTPLPREPTVAPAVLDLADSPDAAPAAREPRPLLPYVPYPP